MSKKVVFYKKLSELIEDINTFRYGFINSDTCWFRGVNKGKEYTLHPSLFRGKLKVHSNIATFENNLYYDFTAFGDGIIKDKNNWHVLYQMQHYAVPTRLLDWTESFGAALFFALEFSNDVDRPCICVLDPFALNELEHHRSIGPKYPNLHNPVNDFNFDYFDEFVLLDKNRNHKKNVFKLPKAIFPIKSNERIKAQKGTFTIHGTRSECMEDCIKDKKGKDKILKKFFIDDKMIGEAREYLKYFGIDFFTIYPDHEGMSKKIRKDYF